MRGHADAVAQVEEAEIEAQDALERASDQRHKAEVLPQELVHFRETIRLRQRSASEFVVSEAPERSEFVENQI